MASRNQPSQCCGPNIRGGAILPEPHLHGTDSPVKTLLSSENPITESVQGQQLYFIT